MADVYQRFIKRNDSFGGCVVGILSFPFAEELNHVLMLAQQSAIAASLPFAATTSIDGSRCPVKKSDFEVLKAVERHLGDFDIPFMLLLGSPEETTRAILHHLNPREVYFDAQPPLKVMTLFTSGENGSWELEPIKLVASDLQTHPVKWPGVVMSIQDLRDKNLFPFTAN